MKKQKDQKRQTDIFKSVAGQKNSQKQLSRRSFHKIENTMQNMRKT
jgi:hypothetical protein